MKLSLDIGGTNIRGVVFEDDEIVKEFRIKTDPDNFKKSMWATSDQITGFEFTHISMGLPGPADYEKGILLNPPNLKGWWNQDIKKAFERYAKPEQILCANDAKLMALANHKSIGGTKDDVTQFFTISTGIGAGLIINDEIYNGFSGMAQEVAHVPVNEIDDNNSYSKGAVEYYASGSGMAKRGKEFGFNSTKELFDAYDKDSNAKAIIDKGIDGLGNLIAASVALVNPNNIVFDGSVARNNKWFIEAAVKVAKTRMYEQQSKSFKWYISTLGDNSVLLGASERIKNA